MTRHTTEWTAPCNCRVEYEWDSDSPDTKRKHKTIRIGNLCSKHKRLKLGEDPFKVIV